MRKLREAIKQHRGRELPRFVNYKPCASLMKDAVATFETPAQECLDVVAELVLRIFLDVLHNNLGQYHDLERRIKVKTRKKHQDI